LKARLEKVTWWLERARPDVLLVQETKLADPEAPTDAFRSAGYALAHHGEGRWNGVAIASRCGIEGVVTNFGEPRLLAKTPDVGDDEPLAEARMTSAVCGGIRVGSGYAPNGRALGAAFLAPQRAWSDRLVTAPLVQRTVWAEIDREARKGKPVPSDHAPLVVDIDERGRPFDAGWTSAEERIAARRPRPR